MRLDEDEDGHHADEDCEDDNGDADEDNDNSNSSGRAWTCGYARFSHICDWGLKSDGSCPCPPLTCAGGGTEGRCS